MRVTDSHRMRFFLLSFLGFLFVLGCACGPPASQSDGGQSSSGSSTGVPELTDEMVRERLRFAYVRNIPEENGGGEPMNWTFMPDEPKEISVVDKQINGNHATVILDVKTRSGPRARGPRELAGQIRTEWELRTGWVLRQWEIVDTENISMKYTKLPTPPSMDNSNLSSSPNDSGPPRPPAANSNR